MDLQTRQDIERLLENFYSQMLDDPLIGHFFTQVVHLDLAHHLPRLTDFWEQVLFGRGNYQGNPMHIHMALNQKEALLPQHFARWLQLFEAAVDAHWQGPFANLAKQRAHGIALTMQAKLSQ